MPSDWPDPKPRVASWPDFVDTWGDEAVDLCEIAGLYLDPWQEISLRVWLGTRPDDPSRWAARRCGMIVPRQDGKGAVLEARQLVGLYLIEDDRLLIHTAHEFKTAEESFMRLRSLIEDTPLRHKLARNGVRTGRGQEAIILRDGSRAKFLARSKKSGRGFTSDLLIYDEAMVLDPATVGASGPTQSARPNPQTVYTATAGDDTSEVLAQVREQGILGTDKLAYVEYSGGDPNDHVGDGIDLDDRDEWFQANPAMWGDDPRMTVEAVEEDRRMMDEENFARERLCIWWTGKRAAVIDPDLWGSLVGKSKPNRDHLAFAVDVPPERDKASIAVASVLEDGRRHWELVARKNGTGWVVDALKKLNADFEPTHGIAVDPSSPAGSLINEISEALEKAKVPVVTVGGTELKQACGQFLDKVTEEAVVVHDNLTADLASAVDALRKREFPDGGFVWHRRDTESDISPVMAVTLASYVLGKEPKKRRKSGRSMAV